MAERLGRALLAPFLAVTLLLAEGCWMVEPSAPGPFYNIDNAALTGSPGDILRVEEYPGAPSGARAWRVLYRSTGLKGEPIAVSGVIIAQENSTPGEKRPVLAWAHGTTGVTSHCAPSLQRGFFYSQIPGLEKLLSHGFVVAATDYPGLGTPGPHPYLVGISEGRSILDAVRAATRLPDVEASNQFAVWGHSQGGHAALFAGQLAPSYAGELELAGVAAAAPATDLSVLLHDDLNTKVGKVFTAFAIWAWNRVYGAPLERLVAASTIPAVDKIAEGCLEGKLQGLVVAEREKAIDKDFLQADLTEVEPWKTLIVRNTPRGEKTGSPLFLAQGAADTVIAPKVTRQYAEAACKAGNPVRFDLRDGQDHLGIAPASADAIVSWLATRFEDSAPANDCGDLAEVAKGSG